MTNPKSNNNGSRAKILRALANNDLLTIQEIVEETKLTAKQVQDNGCQARTAGLIKSERQESTNLILYQITSKGLLWLSENAIHVPAHDEPTATDKESLSVPCLTKAIETTAEVKESLTTSGPEIDPPATAEDSSAVAPTETAIEEPNPIAADDLQPEPKVVEEFLYAIDSPFDKDLRICGTDRQAAIDRALVLAQKNKAIFNVFRLVFVGTSVPLVTVTSEFVEAVS